MVFRVHSLNRYLFKGARANDLGDSAYLAKRGFAYDRFLMLMTEEGDFVSQRNYPRIALLSTRLSRKSIFVQVPGNNEFEIPLRFSGSKRTIQLHSKTVDVIVVDDFYNQIFSDFLGVRCSVVRKDQDTHRQLRDGFYRPETTTELSDGSPALLVTLPSLSKVNEKLVELGQSPVGIDRVRANIILDGGDSEPFIEHSWSILRFGDRKEAVIVRCAKPSDRCVVTTVDQATGVRGESNFLKALCMLDIVPRDIRWSFNFADWQNDKLIPFFGENLEVVNPGVIAVGDVIHIEEYRNRC